MINQTFKSHSTTEAIHKVIAESLLLIAFDIVGPKS